MTRLFILIALLSSAASLTARAEEPSADQPEEPGAEAEQGDLAKKV